MSNGFNDERDATKIPITELPPNYDVYCIFIPSGFDDEFEGDIFQKLFAWGENMGSNIFVAPWKIGDSSYKKLVEALKGDNFRRTPAIILTDDKSIRSDSFKIIIDDPILISSMTELKKILPDIVHQLFMKQGLDAKKVIKDALKQNKREAVMHQIKNALGTATTSILDRGLILSMGPASVEIPPKSR